MRYIRPDSNNTFMSGFCFSIITVCLDVVKSVRCTIESIQNQSFSDYEWIVVDGGSTDGTIDVLDDYSEHIATLISEPDRGIYHAMNKGIAHAKGEYVIFMNAGDFFANKDVLAAVNAAPRADLLIGDLIFSVSDKVRSLPDELPDNFLLTNMLPHQATFFRRQLFESHGHFDESFRIAGDYEMFARLIQSGEVSYRHVPKTIAVFQGGGISESAEYRKIRKQENHRVRWKYFPAYRKSLKAIRQQVRNFLTKKAL